MAVSGYSSATSALPGSSISFYLSTDSPGITSLTVERIGTTTVSSTLSTTLFTRSLPATNPWEGFGWPVSVTFNIPSNWPPGLYRLAYSGQDVLTFVIRPATQAAVSKVLLQISFLTPTAYNAAGGKSLYDYNSGGAGTRASKVSFNRSGGTPASNGPESILIRWLETEGIPIEYCSSVDLHSISTLLTNYDCLIIAGHDEYWTRAMRDQTEQFIANGGNVIVLSGNTCYRAVRLEQGNRMVVFYKYAGNDPNLNAYDTTVAWAEPPLNRPQNSFLGSGFADGAYSGTSPTVAYTIRFPGHWVFNGVSPATTTSAFMTYEVDAAAYVDEVEGYPRVTGDQNTPLTTTVLASADMRSWTGKPGRATMSIFSHNGTVFNAGTTDWLSVLGSDSVVTTITRNVFSHLKQRITWDWENIGYAYNSRALTALYGKIFIATSQNRLAQRYPLGADIPWRDISYANYVSAMAALGDTLYCITTDNQLWWYPASEVGQAWTSMGAGPSGGTKALAATGGMLYAVDNLGTLWRAPATRTAPSWVAMTAFTQDATINAMTAYGDILFASTTDNRLLRSNSDYISESTAWVYIHHCDYSAGLAVVESMLFVATTQNLLWKIDLYGLRQP
ncbi:N,N-dimethylformamidase beta subunit family domain-containing protein [Acinetobacter sp. ABJ_C1_1]|uniref:N,N-dimethylformamidase beta subunit family domain-containing protein n=1 Tax=Acinetobacter sp. ABJ_C1_1 TaxID=3378321 RepID=UPI0037DC9AE2